MTQRPVTQPPGDPGASRVLDALGAVPRRLFLPADQQRLEGSDQPLPIGHGQTNSQPTTVRRCLDLLAVHRGQRVLDVGSGSGWTTALLAWLVGPDGAVYGVERVPELVEFGRANLAAWRATQGWSPRASIAQARTGELGLPEHAPYDRVLVSAGSESVPWPLVDQLISSGILVAPVAGRLVTVRRDGEEVRVERRDHCRFVPLLP